MPTIAPVSDLRNYGNVLEKVAVGSPVYLTRNGHGVYSIRDMEDEENFQKAEAMTQRVMILQIGMLKSLQTQSQRKKYFRFQEPRGVNLPFFLEHIALLL